MLTSQRKDNNVKISPEKSDTSYWNTWYLAVFIFLLLQIIIFYLITVEFK
jgi:hypothetical protein